MEKIKEGYTRVSDILKTWQDFSMIDPAVLANKCRIGTEVHQKIQAEEEGYFIEISEDCQGYFESWKAWRENQDYAVVKTEQRYYCDDLKITGAIDAICFDGRKRFIIDYKTSASAHPKTWALQAIYYHHLAKENGYAVDDEVMFLQLKKNGKKARVHYFKYDPELWITALALIRSHHYFFPCVNVNC